jgi:excisionase family DNA binding protein
VLQGTALTGGQGDPLVSQRGAVMATPSDAGDRTRPISTAQQAVAVHHDRREATARRKFSVIDDRRHSERPPPSQPSSPFRGQGSDFVAHLALAMSRYARDLRRDRLPVPPAIDELAALLMTCARSCPTTTQVDDEESTTQDVAMAGPLLITKAEAGEYLSVSIRTVERLISAGKLPLVHVEGAARLRGDRCRGVRPVAGSGWADSVS